MNAESPIIKTDRLSIRKAYSGDELFISNLWNDPEIKTYPVECYIYYFYKSNYEKAI